MFPNAADAKLGNWTRITRALQRESGTTGWHRHDLRRTAASIMLAVGVTLPVIDGILEHKAGEVPDGVSAAVANYVVPIEIQIAVPHPQRDALIGAARAASVGARHTAWTCSPLRVTAVQSR